MNISVVIPAYNEEKRIKRTLMEYGRVFDERVKRGLIKGYVLLVVINNTTDRTQEIVDFAASKNQNIKSINLKKGGKGFAVMEGVRWSLKKNFDLVGFADADMATSPKDFFDLISGLGSMDVAIANRHSRKSKVSSSFKRRVFSRGFSFLVRSTLFMPFSDTQCGAKVFRRNAAEFIARRDHYSKWAFDVEVLHALWKGGFGIVEIPTVWRDVDGGSVNLFKTPLQMFIAVMRVRILNSPFRGLVNLYDSLPEKIKIHHRW